MSEILSFVKTTLSILTVDTSDCLSDLPILLEGTQHRLLVAGRVSEALQFVVREVPQIVVADLQMPDAKALALVDALRLSVPYLTVIVVTESNSLHLAREAIRRGAWNYLVKPVRRDELEKVMEDAIERATFLLRDHDPEAEFTDENIVAG